MQNVFAVQLIFYRKQLVFIAFLSWHETCLYRVEERLYDI
jgi:hypothetical protein